MWAPWVRNLGGDVLNAAGTACTLDQQPAVEGLQFLQDLIHKHRVMLRRSFAALWDGSRTARQVLQEAVPQVNRILKEQAS